MASTARRLTFNNCMAAIAPEYRGVTLDKKMSDAEIRALAVYVNAKNLDILTYTGLKRVSDLICRWLRPSEISRIEGALNKPNKRTGLKYIRHTAAFTLVDGKHISTVIGSMGKNLVTLTKTNNLLYSWVNKTKTGYRLEVFYTNPNGKITKEETTKGRTAIFKFFKFHKDHVRKSGSETVTVKSFMSAASPNFVPSKKTVVQSEPEPSFSPAELKGAYIDIFDANKTFLKPFTLRNVQLSFHPDKLPNELKALIRSNKRANIYVSRVFAAAVEACRDEGGYFTKPMLIEILDDERMIGGTKTRKK